MTKLRYDPDHELYLGLGLRVVHDQVGRLVDHLSDFPQVDHF